MEVNEDLDDLAVDAAAALERFIRILLSLNPAKFCSLNGLTSV
jgi:hypothetical protein